MRRTIIAVFVVVAGGCGSDGPGLSLSVAQDRLRTMVDATARAVADGLPVTSDPEAFAVTSCEDSGGSRGGTYTAPYRVILGIKPDTDIPALFERTRSYWDDEGYDVGEIRVPDSSRPRMFADRGGYGLVLEVQNKLGRALLDGGTPCLKDPGRKSS